MASIPVYVITATGKMVISMLVLKAIEKYGRDYFYPPPPPPPVDPIPAVVPDRVSSTDDASATVETQEEVMLEDYNRDNVYTGSPVVNPSSPTVNPIPAVVPDRVSSTEDASATVETQEEVLLEDYNRDNGDEDDDFKEDNVERDSAKPKKNFHTRRPNCYNYLRTGTCRFGANCRYNHPARKENQARRTDSPEFAQVIKEKEKEDLSQKKGQQECKYYLQPGGCKFGKACRYNHSQGKRLVPPPLPTPPLDFNFLDLPIRPGERECRNYMLYGLCKYGRKCRFHHPDPVAIGGGDIPSGSVSLDPSGALLPASTSWSSLLNETDPYLDAANPDVPIMMLPSLGVHPNPEWNEYQATFEHEGKQLVLIANPNHPGWSKPKTTPAVNRIYKKSAKKTKIVPSLWCEICKINCASKDDLGQHKFGEKHKENMDKLEESKKEASAQAAMASPAAMDPVISPKVIPIADEDKTVVQSAWCEICNLDHSSKDVSDQHKLEKKHKDLEKLEESKKEANAPAATEALEAKDPVIGSNPEWKWYQATFTHKGKRLLLVANPNHPCWSKPKSPPAVNGTRRKGAKKTKIVQSLWCEICKIHCPSEDALGQHKLGKKHKENMDKLEESKKEASTSAAKDPMIGPSPEWNLYQGTFTHNGKQLLLVATPNLHGCSKPKTPPAVDGTCKIGCTSKDDLGQHNLGKKPKENMEKLEESKKEASAPVATVAPAVNDPVIGPKESPAAQGKKERYLWGLERIWRQEDKTD